MMMMMGMGMLLLDHCSVHCVSGDDIIMFQCYVKLLMSASFSLTINRYLCFVACVQGRR